MTNNENTTNETTNMLERLVDMIEEGHQLTDDEMDLLARDEEAADAYRQLVALKNVVAQPAPLPRSVKMDDTDDQTTADDGLDDEPERTVFARMSNWWWPLVGIAASLLALIYLSRPVHKYTLETVASVDQPSVVERVKTPVDSVKKPKGKKNFFIAGVKVRSSRAKVSMSEGQLVLDYQSLSDAGYTVSNTIETDTVVIPNGKDFKLVLSDGTEVWLYANSKLVYPSQFIGNERTVFLDGEAYFRVTKDASHPFVVKTECLDARVLGTELNVCSRQENGKMPHVALITGMVEVSSCGETAMLMPGQGASLTIGRGLEVETECMENYIFWRNGYMYFDNSSLMDIAQQLGRWYNVKVSLTDERLANMNLHFSYKRSDGLKRIVRLLNSFGEFNAEVKDGTLSIEH